MDKKDIEKWVETAKVNDSVIYYNGNLSEIDVVIKMLL